MTEIQKPDSGLLWFRPMPVRFFVDEKNKRRFHLQSATGHEAITTIPRCNSLPHRPTTIGNRWEACIHPEGRLYFRYQNFLTNAYLYDDDTLVDNMNLAVELIEQRLVRERQLHTDVPRNIEIVIHIIADEEQDSKDKLLCYYICDLDKREVLWLTEQEVEYLVDVEGHPVYDHEHLQYAYAMSFWIHIQMFPHERPSPPADQVLGELQKDLRYLAFDGEISKASTAHFRVMDVDYHQARKFVNEIQHEGNDFLSSHDMAIVAKLKGLLAYHHFHNYHQTKWVRLSAKSGVHEDLETMTQRSTTFKLLSWFFFATPAAYIKLLDEVWVDNAVNYRAWQQFISELQDDWVSSITPSTVLLTTNVGFLAIKSIDEGGDSAGQVLSYLSTFLTIGNIVACAILTRQLQPALDLGVDSAATYLEQRASGRLRVELLATILSVPTVMFVWSLIAFSAALLSVCVNRTSIPTTVLSALTVVLVIGLLVLVWSNRGRPPSGPPAPTPLPSKRSWISRFLHSLLWRPSLAAEKSTSTVDLKPNV
ncbi:hypothetical protein BD413DRAFT_189429 [Trametes elegans]|nr:hypothetical protein BD413DRAFT_189429 [Trametes elegans]